MVSVQVHVKWKVAPLVSVHFSTSWSPVCIYWSSSLPLSAHQVNRVNCFTVCPLQQLNCFALRLLVNSTTQALPPKKGQRSIDEHNDTIGNLIYAFSSALIDQARFWRSYMQVWSFLDLCMTKMPMPSCKYIVLQENEVNSWKVSLQSFIGSWSGTPDPDLVHDRIAAFDTTTRNRIMNLECFGWKLFLILHCWPGGGSGFCGGGFSTHSAEAGSTL